MNAIVDQIVQRSARMKATVLPDNKAKGLLTLFRQNTFTMLIECSRAWLIAVRGEAPALDTYSQRVSEWRDRVLDLDTFDDLGLGLIAGDVFGQVGYLLGWKPNVKEIEYIGMCRNSPDFLNPLSAISYNLYFGEKPDKSLPAKFDKRLQKDAEDVLALLENPEKGIAKAEKMWQRRARSNAHRWYGTGPAHDYLLDPLILCILKYHKADFESDSIHMKGYRFLVKNGF